MSILNKKIICAIIMLGLLTGCSSNNNDVNSNDNINNENLSKNDEKSSVSDEQDNMVISPG